MQNQHPSKLIVLGSGNFGTCLALHLTRLGHNVTIWTRSSETRESINKYHRNPKYLSQITLPDNLHASTELNYQTLAGIEMIILAIPTQSMRQVLGQLKGKISPQATLVCAAKGIEMDTLLLPSDIICEVLGSEFKNSIAVLSGPSFAMEIATQQPTAVSTAAFAPERAQKVQSIFHSPLFRVYRGNDPIGLEVAGAMKNVIAIANGACCGLGLQANSQAALITRGLAEMTRVGLALHANQITFQGLGGVGDLFLTCTSEKSRNFTVGFRLGKGEALTDVLRTVGSVAEGVSTTKSAFALCKKIGVRAPITTAVYQVLYEKRPIVEVFTELTTGDAKEEHV